MKRFIALLILLLPATAEAQARHAFVRFDIDSATATYGELRGQGGRPDGGPIPVGITIKTTGSATAVTAAVASSAPFANLAAGDVISVTLANGTIDNRFIAAKADSNNITIDTAADWSNSGNGFVFRYWDATTCTDATCGWMDVTSLPKPTIFAQYERGDLATGAEVVFECRGSGINAQGIQVWPSTAGTFGSFTTANVGTVSARQALALDVAKFQQCRIGVRASGADTADVVGTSTELFTAWIE